MTKEIFPEGQIIFKNKPYTSEFLSITMDEIDKAGESFMGMLKADEPDAAYFLFFLKGDAYAAGCIKKRQAHADKHKGFYAAYFNRHIQENPLSA